MNHWLITANHITVLNMYMLLKSNPFNAKIIIRSAKQLDSSNVCCPCRAFFFLCVVFIFRQVYCWVESCDLSPIQRHPSGWWVLVEFGAKFMHTHSLIRSQTGRDKEREREKDALGITCTVSRESLMPFSLQWK